MANSVYRYFDASGRLLYVGQSENPFGRLYSHAKDKDMTLVRQIQVEWFPDFIMADMAERWAIKTENPLWNKAGRNPAPDLRTTPQEAFDERKNPLDLLDG